MESGKPTTKISATPARPVHFPNGRFVSTEALSPDRPIDARRAYPARWRYRPGSDFFVVYRTDQPFGQDSDGTPRDPFHEVIFKVAVYMRALLG